MSDSATPVPAAAPTTRSSAAAGAVRRDRLMVGLAYLLAWAPMLVNRGLYWDDWTLVGQSPASLVATFGELGMPWLGYLFAAVFATPLPGLVGHILTFVAYLASSLILHAILLRMPALTRMDAIVAALTFAVLPVNYARVALIDLSYGLSLLAFLAATWLLLRYVEVGGRGRRVAALALFVCSFGTASLLVVYVVPVALAAYVATTSGRERPSSFLLRHAEFVALPIAYWVVKSLLFAPSGVYEGYNALTPSGLARVPSLALAIPGQVLIEPLARAVSVAGLAGLAAGAVVAVWLHRRGRVREAGRFVPAPLLALAGVVVLGLGVFAYLAVGRIPTIWDWSSRHQLLVPLGVALLGAAAARAITVGRAGAAVAVALGVLVGASIVADARTLVAYQRDWYKQTALIAHARSMPELETARHIRVVDSATGFNTLRRTYRFYEYNALLGAAIGDTRRLASDGVHEPDADELQRFVDRPGYHMEQYVPSPVDLELRVAAPDGLPTTFEVLRFLVLESLGSASFEPEVSRLIDVTSSPVAGARAP